MDHAARRPTDESPWGSGASRRTPEPQYLAVGQILGPHGIQGELRAEILTQDPERFALLSRVYIGREGEIPEPRDLLGYRLHKSWVLLRIEGCRTRDAAESLEGYLVQIPLAEAIPLEDGEYYEHQILGLAAFTPSGDHLGVVEEILYTGANDVYVIRAPGPGSREILIPAIHSVVLEIDLDAGRLIIDLPPGLA